jgi:hypothetical protein
VAYRIPIIVKQFVSLCKMRRLKSRHLAEAQAVSRSLSGVDEVIKEEGADGVADFYDQLDKRGQELTVDLGDQQVIEDEALLALVDKSLCKLAKRRRELTRGAAGGGPPSSMPDDGGGRREAQPLQAEVPPANSGGGGNVSLTADQLKDILAALAGGGGKPKLPVPPWPTFLDTYRSFFLFREELGAYIKDYGHGMTERTLAQQIKKNCLSKQSAAYVEWAMSPAEILETLAGLFGGHRDSLTP